MPLMLPLAVALAVNLSLTLTLTVTLRTTLPADTRRRFANSLTVCDDRPARHDEEAMFRAVCTSMCRVWIEPGLGAALKERRVADGEGEALSGADRRLYNGTSAACNHVLSVTTSGWRYHRPCRGCIPAAMPASFMSGNGLQVRVHMLLIRVHVLRVRVRAPANVADINQRREVRVGGGDAPRAAHRDVRHVDGDEAPAVHGGAQQRVDQVGAAANVQASHRPCKPICAAASQQGLAACHKHAVSSPS